MFMRKLKEQVSAVERRNKKNIAGIRNKKSFCEEKLYNIVRSKIILILVYGMYKREWIFFCCFGIRVTLPYHIMLVYDDTIIYEYERIYFCALNNFFLSKFPNL